MDVELSIFMKTETRVHTNLSLPQSLHQIIIIISFHLHNRNDVKTIVVQECRGLSCNLQTFIERRKQGNVVFLLDQQ